MLYLCPPIRLIEDCGDLGRQVQQRLATAVAEVELLSVAAGGRQRGVGSALLEAAEQVACGRGGRLVYAKVQRDSASLLRWYGKRGYQLVPVGEPVVLAVAGTKIGFADGDDGFRMLAKLI